MPSYRDPDQLRHNHVVFIESAPTADCEQVSQHLEQRTRERVLEAVSEHGPLTAAELGRRLGLTPAAVRRHLDALAEQSVVEEHDPSSTASRGRGRPARSWVVSGVGHRALADDYDELAAQTLRFLAAQAGPAAVEAFARERVAGLETRYAGRLAAAGDLPHDRVDALVAALTEDGYAASARPVGDGVGPFTGIQLCQGHCPVGRVAEEFPAFCDAETDAISRLLGVHVQRLATLAGGAHVCTTFIPTTSPTPTGQAGTPAGRPALNHKGPKHQHAVPDHPHERSSR
jgi:predicted ArsR family transcriptional regulator